MRAAMLRPIWPWISSSGISAKFVESAEASVIDEDVDRFVFITSGSKSTIASQGAYRKKFLRNSIARYTTFRFEIHSI
jgi:hypothetical protein